MKKHLLICTLALLLALGCAACGGTAEKTETNTDTAGTVNVEDLDYSNLTGCSVGVGITEIPEGINRETLALSVGDMDTIGMAVLYIGVLKDDAYSPVAGVLFSTGEEELDAKAVSDLEEANPIPPTRTRTEAKDAQGHTVYIYQNEEAGELSEELLADWEAVKANLNALLQNLVVFEPEYDSVVFTTTDINGTTVNSKELFAQADYTLVNVWATTCSICIEEMPDLQALNDEMENVQVVLLLKDADSPDSEEAQTASKILSTQQVTLPCLLHNAETDELLPVTGTPTTYLVDSNGTVLSKRTGESSKEKYMEWITSAIQ